MLNTDRSEDPKPDRAGIWAARFEEQNRKAKNRRNTMNADIEVKKEVDE